MTLEFKAAVTATGQITLPADIAGQIPAGKELHVVLTWQAAVDSDALRLARTLQEKSLAASVEDSVYDSLA
jgi:hypothetical protein